MSRARGAALDAEPILPALFALAAEARRSAAGALALQQVRARWRNWRRRRGRPLRYCVRSGGHCFRAS